MSEDRDRERRIGKIFTILTAIAALAFTVVWCGLAVATDAWYMLIFGLPCVGLALFRLVAMFRALRPEDPSPPEDPADPWSSPASGRIGSCPYCGNPVSEDFDYCPKCGRRLQ